MNSRLAIRQASCAMPAGSSGRRRAPARRRWLCCLVLGTVAVGCSGAAEESGLPVLELGVNRPNLVWFAGSDVARQTALLDTIHRAGARRIRLALQLPYERALAHILHCNRLGMDVTLWICSGHPEFYRPGTRKRAGIPNPEGEFPFLFDQYRLADLDVVRFRRVLGRFLRHCSQRGARIGALQVMTEPNWADFNGDLPVVDGGWFIDDATPWDDARFVVVRRGIQRCGEALKAAREVVKGIEGMEDTLILTPAMAGPPDAWVRRVNGSLIRSELYLQLLRGRHPKQIDAPDYVRFADGIGVHIYPEVVDVSPERGRATALRVITERLSPMVARAGLDRPYWVTEWGYPRWRFGNPPDEARRLAQFHTFLEALKRYRPGEITWGQVLLFNFDMMYQHNVYDEGELLPSAAILRLTEY